MAGRVAPSGCAAAWVRRPPLSRSDGSRGKSWRGIAVAATTLSLALVLLVAVAVRLVAGARHDPLPEVVPRLVPTNIRFFADPHSSAAAWVQNHRHDGRARLISRRIASQPQGVWFAAGNPDSIHGRVEQTSTEAAVRHELPLLVMYAVPHRDCAKKSAGGAASVADYRRWVDGFSKGLGPRPAWVIVEPDALMQVGCLTASQRAARFRAVTYAARTLHEHNASARIYYDAGNSSWHSPDETASLLRQADVGRYGDGIALNVANFNRTDDEVRFGMEVIRALANPKLRMVIDTGRNGSGGVWRDATCDPPEWRLGTRPTSRTGDAWVDGFVWVKPPGQSDGCRASPGTFLPGEAYHAARRTRGGPPYLKAMAAGSRGPQISRIVSRAAVATRRTAT